MHAFGALWPRMAMLSRYCTSLRVQHVGVVQDDISVAVVAMLKHTWVWLVAVAIAVGYTVMRAMGVKMTRLTNSRGKPGA
jgi:hypothetical protein